MYTKTHWQGAKQAKTQENAVLKHPYGAEIDHYLQVDVLSRLISKSVQSRLIVGIRTRIFLKVVCEFLMEGKNIDIHCTIRPILFASKEFMDAQGIVNDRQVQQEKFSKVAWSKPLEG
ncbi:hypothetical protein GOBAR_AA40297 [Gossypium barbadense]|uniref:Uncharacterized protein n=1 Tax=Gossypium barbadense TaxID=3634 RepID=A0A2P5VNL1_GOSBA|nr:hypothetical protein GOBAR_AA40297 [Gossypium barbadense]